MQGTDERPEKDIDTLVRQESKISLDSQQSHLRQLVVSLEDALDSLAAPTLVGSGRSVISRLSASSSLEATPTAGKDTDSLDTGAPDPAQLTAVVLTPETAVGLAEQALVAVKNALALTASRDQHVGILSTRGRESDKQEDEHQGEHQDDRRVLRAALSCTISTLRNACVGAASSTAKVLGGDDPAGFVQEVRALAEVHETQLTQAVQQEELLQRPQPQLQPQLQDEAGHRGRQDESSRRAGGSIRRRPKRQANMASSDVSGVDFWARESDLWSGVFMEQQAGLLQIVGAQDAEVRQGRQRIALLERELSSLKEKEAASERTGLARAWSDGAKGRAKAERDDRRVCDTSSVGESEGCPRRDSRHTRTDQQL